MQKKLLKKCKSKIDGGSTYEELVYFIYRKGHEHVFSEIKEEVKGYIDKKMKNEKMNTPYWMLVCDPQKWHEGTEAYQVNQLLKDLDKDSIEPWKINSRRDMEKMKVGHRGFINVTKDKRKKIDRMDEEGTIVDKLEAGIYGIFEVVEDKDGESTYKSEAGEYFVNIKVIDNFYAKGTNSSKKS